MSTSFEQTNQQRAQFVGYSLTAVSVLFAIDKITQLLSPDPSVQYSELQTSVSWLHRIVLTSGNIQIWALVLLGAAFLLMLDSDDEPKLMKASIVVTFVLGVAASVLALAGMFGQFFDDSTSSTTTGLLEDFLLRVTSLAPSLAACILTWGVVRSLQWSDDIDDDIAGEPETNEQ